MKKQTNGIIIAVVVIGGLFFGIALLIKDIWHNLYLLFPHGMAILDGALAWVIFIILIGMLGWAVIGSINDWIKSNWEEAGEMERMENVRQKA